MIDHEERLVTFLEQNFERINRTPLVLTSGHLDIVWRIYLPLLTVIITLPVLHEYFMYQVFD